MNMKGFAVHGIFVSQAYVKVGRPFAACGTNPAGQGIV